VPSAQLQEDIQTVKARTDRPFGVHFLLALPKPGDEEAVATQRFLNRFREELDLLNKYLLSGSARSRA
jgi:hypothetical protein